MVATLKRGDGPYPAGCQVTHLAQAQGADVVLVDRGRWDAWLRDGFIAPVDAAVGEDVPAAPPAERAKPPRRKP